MAQVINTNILSLNAQRNLNNTSGALQTSLQRLSSGLRINSAKDDAAGLAISERFTTQIRGLNQAIRNANDGISLAQTGEGALAEINNNLQRIRELAVQSVNASNSANDRIALNREVEQRFAEIDRIAAQTSFNGRKILDGSFGNAAFQVGANVGETIDLALQTSMRRDAVGAVSKAVTVDLDGLISPAVSVVTASTGNLGAFTPGGVSTNATTFTLALDASANGGGTVNIVTNRADGETLDVAALAAGIEAARASIESAGFTIAGADAAEIQTHLTNGTLSFSRADGRNFTMTESVGGAGTLAATPTFAATTDSSGTALTTTDGVVAASASTLDLTAGQLQIQLGESAAVSVAAGSYATADAFLNAVNTALAGNASATLDSDNVLSFTSGEAITIAADGQGVFTAGSYAAEGSLASADVLTVGNANTTIQRVDAALTSVSDLRSTFGAIQNRFESTIANLSTVTENLESSRSRILDADFAAETAALTRAQILQQAGISVLSQANAAPQSVLSLLR